MEKVIIVGSGCAGLTAAIYAARANLSPLVLEGRQPGGQLSTTTLVENYPGFPDGIDGPELILNMHRQAEKFGARFSYAEVTDLEPGDKHIRLQADDEWLQTRALIIASGATARYLGLADEEKLVGHGLTSRATCDGEFRSAPGRRVVAPDAGTHYRQRRDGAISRTRPRRKVGRSRLDLLRHLRRRV